MKMSKITVKLSIVLIAVVSIIVYIVYTGTPATDILRQGVPIVSEDIAIAMEETGKPAKEIVNPSGFINTDRITISEFIRKKVILVDFWTYSCINCQRTFPYLNAWYEKYKDKGLLIVGIHTPEFRFEKKYENVQAAVKKFGLKYPVVLDNDYDTWRAYGNRYWPRKYLINIHGNIVYDHIGEGAYEETEKKIQDLLDERMKVLGEQKGVEREVSKPRDAPAVNFAMVRSPEVYFGSDRNEYLGNGKQGISGIQTLTTPSKVKLNTLYLVGEWNFQDEFAENKSRNAKIIFRYQAKNVYMVANSPGSVKLRISMDGKPLKKDSGEDVSKEGTVTVKEDRLYKLIEGSEYGEHTIEITVESPGFRAYTFTFG